MVFILFVYYYFFLKSFNQLIVSGINYYPVFYSQRDKSTKEVLVYEICKCEIVERMTSKKHGKWH